MLDQQKEYLKKAAIMGEKYAVIDKNAKKLVNQGKLDEVFNQYLHNEYKDE